MLRRSFHQEQEDVNQAEHHRPGVQRVGQLQRHRRAAELLQLGRNGVGPQLQMQG